MSRPPRHSVLSADVVSPDDPAVSLHSLTRRFGDVTAVDGLTFDVARGELFGVVGPDGAGKTTLLRMLAGVLPPSSGDATLFGRSVARDGEAVKSDIAYMSQRFGLYEDLTVRENILFYADLYRVPRAQLPERVRRLHAFSRLGEFEDRLAGRLSGGMKQKLGLSCALVHQPKLLLLDEPTFGVDPISRRDLWLMLHEMVEGGMTIIVSTSYMDEAERCDRVALLNAGRLLTLDRPGTIQDRIADRLYEVRGADPAAIRDVLRRTTGVAHAALFGDAVHAVLEPGASAAGVRESAAAAGALIDDMRPLRGSLEDAFIDLVPAAPS